MKKIIAPAVLLAVLVISAGCTCGKLYPADKAVSVGNTKPIKIGWAKRSLDMNGPVYISGQFYTRYSLGSLSPVIASTLVLDNGDDSVIFISADIISITPAILNGVRDLVRKEMPEIPAEKIIINATHTHTGPSPHNLPDFPHKSKIISGEKVRAFIARQMADAVKEAWTKRAPGSIAYGYGFAVTGHNRRSTYLVDIGKRFATERGFSVNGHAKMYGATNDKDFAGYENGMDAYVNLLYTFDCKGKLTGAIINVPCPSQTSENIWMLYASFWHNVREKLTAKYGDIGVITQAAAAGDLAPRQLHYRQAEARRYKIKYADKIAAYLKAPIKHPGRTQKDIDKLTYASGEVLELMRAEDIANRITAAFDEVLSWAAREKFANPVLKHQLKTLHVKGQTFPAELVEIERKSHNKYMNRKYLTDAPEFEVLRANSLTYSLRARSGNVVRRYEEQNTKKTVPIDIHVVRIGDIAFATNRFELYMDFMHRIQARSPFLQTFIVQLAGDRNGSGSYLATERAMKNKGYSASSSSNRVSFEGGQEMVEGTLEVLNKMR